MSEQDGRQCTDGRLKQIYLNETCCIYTWIRSRFPLESPIESMSKTYSLWLGMEHARTHLTGAYALYLIGFRWVIYTFLLVLKTRSNSITIIAKKLWVDVRLNPSTQREHTDVPAVLLWYKNLNCCPPAWPTLNSARVSNHMSSKM